MEIIKRLLQYFASKSPPRKLTTANFFEFLEMMSGDFPKEMTATQRREFVMWAMRCEAGSVKQIGRWRIRKL